ncbi:MAG: glycine-rich domain-containing protein [Actinomycetes bacterium]
MASLPTSNKSALLPFAIASGLGLATASAGLAAPAFASGDACTAADSHAVMVAAGVCERSITATGVSSWTVPAGVTSVDVLSVAGGGGGGGHTGGIYAYSAGGGGGGGQVTYCRETVKAHDSLGVTLGAGGIGGTVSGTAATDGGTSSVHDTTHAWAAACAAVGGKAGGAGDSSSASGDGGASGSFAGGAATPSSMLAGGGGAGAATKGVDASTTTDSSILTSPSVIPVTVATPGAGGAGKMPSAGLFAGSAIAFGGGGGGGGSGQLFDNSSASYGTQGAGGNGGGGTGAGVSTKPAAGYFSTLDCTPIVSGATAGTANTGGGGGGATSLGCNANPYNFVQDAGAGGSGKVLIRWSYPAATAFTTQQNVSHQVNVFAQAAGGFIPVSAHVVTAPKHGKVTKTSASVFTYAPDADYYGTDIYTVALVNAAGQDQVLTVNATITHVLPATGAEGVLPLGLTAGLLLLTGGLALAVSRRRSA